MDARSVRDVPNDFSRVRIYGNYMRTPGMNTRYPAVS